MIARRYDEPPDGQARKQAAQDRLEACRAVYILKGRRALLTAVLAKGQATADDVRDGVELPEGIDPVCLGCVPGPLVKTGIIRRAGFAPTTRTAGHARPVTVWELVDRAAAMRWLMDCPEIEDPAPVETDAGPTLFTNLPGVAAPDRRKDSTHGL